MKGWPAGKCRPSAVSQGVVHGAASRAQPSNCREGMEWVGSLLKPSIQIQIPHYRKGDSVAVGNRHKLRSPGSRFWDANQHAGDWFGNAFGISICGRKRWQVGLSREDRSSLRFHPSVGWGSTPAKALAFPTGNLKEPFRIVLWVGGGGLYVCGVRRLYPPH